MGVFESPSRKTVARGFPRIPLRPLALLVLALVPAASGCTYWESRVRDFGDCFRFSVGAGLGIHADAHVGILGTGLGYWKGKEIGWFPDHGWHTADSENFWIPVPILCLPLGILVASLQPSSAG